MDPFANSRLAQIIYDERISESEADEAHIRRPADLPSAPLIDVLCTIRAFAASLRPARRSFDV